MRFTKARQQFQATYTDEYITDLRFWKDYRFGPPLGEATKEGIVWWGR